jgi:transposase-like protein
MTRHLSEKQSGRSTMGNRWGSLARELEVSEGLLYQWKKEAVESASDSERQMI